MRKFGSARRALLSFGAAASICVALGSVAWADGPSSHRDQLPPPRAGRRPPPEAFEACQGRSDGAECSVAFRGETLDGVCVAPPDDELFCLPNDLPPPPEGPPPGRIVM